MLEEALRREQALLEADRRKDRFLATLAHELRGPLAPLRNSLEIIKRAGGRPVLVEQAVATMERQVQHMVRLVDDLYDISRIVNDKLVLKRTPVDVRAIVQQALEAAMPQLDARGHVLAVDLPPEPLPVSGDSMRLAQVLANLLANAAKYTDGPGRITLRATREGKEVLIRVKDSGIGIACERLPELFHMFHQLDTSLERSRGGLGIGLALARRIVELHQGTIEAASEGPSHGSEFIVRLPALD